MFGPGPPADRAIYSETSLPRFQYGWSELRSMIRGNLHYIEAPEEELYDLASDPGETRDVAGEQPAALARMRARLLEVQSALGLPDLDAPLAVGAEAPELDAATREQLRALGYAE